jgi:geranylgeranylglycerol-phosphate geranylgeranyltransferase
MKKIKALLQLMRVGNCAMAAIGTAIGYFLSSSEVSMALPLAMVSVFLICGAGQAINDVFDAKIDAKISKKRPIPSGKIAKGDALNMAFALFLLGVLATIPLNFTALTIAIAFAFLLIIYSAAMGKAKYLGNFVVASGTAFTFVFGAAASPNGIVPIVILFALSALFANLARELTKDFEDIKKDKGFKISLPMRAPLSAKILIAADYTLAVFGTIYLALIISAAIIFSYSYLQLIKKNYKKSQEYSKIGMLISLAAYVSVLFI